jgi:hypothetical protein
MQPLILVNTSVLVTVSVQNISASRAGAATELSVKLKPQQEIGRQLGGHRIDEDEPVPRRVDGQISKRRHQQRVAAG